MKVRINEGILVTTVGRLIFNNIMPEDIKYINENVGSKKLSSLISELFNTCGKDITGKIADLIKDKGFEL